MAPALHKRIEMTIAGMGMIFYSPFAVSHIGEGEDYLERSFWEPEDVAKSVMDGRISAFCTGTPGDFILEIDQGPYDERKVAGFEVAIRLGLEVRDGLVCFRDLYDLMGWEPACPAEQQVAIPNGYHRVTAATSRPASGVLGQQQLVYLHFEQVPERPRLKWEGVPDLIPGDTET